MAKSLYKIEFNKNVESAKLCTVVLKENDITTLQSAIEDLYYFEFVSGNLISCSKHIIGIKYIF
jgi:hypothetical protein